MKPLLIVSGFLAVSAVGVGLAIGPLLQASADDAPATTQSITPKAPQPVTAAVAPAPAPVAPPPPKVEPRRNYTYKSFEVDGSYIAMTFDDGPSPETTPKLLAILRERGIKATFFVLGTMAVKHPELLKQIADDGHEIGNHSWSHPQLTRISAAAADKQIADTSEIIFQATGKRPLYLRPPYGSMKPALRSHIEQTFGLSIVNWSVDPNDWKDRDSQKVYDAIMTQAKPGAIVLSHDIYATTVAAMPRVLDDLAAKGYKFATLSQMIAMDKPQKPVAMAALQPNGQPKAQKPKPNASANGSTKPASKPVAANSAPKPQAPKPSTAASPAQPRAGNLY